MARGINKATIIGNLGQDPDVRYTPGGMAIATLSIATSEAWKDKQTGEKKEKTEWHRVKLFNRLAEVAGQYLKKGTKVYVEGRLQTDKYEKDGVTHYTTNIICQDMQILSGGAQRDAQQGSSQQPDRQPGADDDLDDDIPF